MGENRVFWIALAVSLVFHLSMVTLFSINIFFHIKPTQYYNLDFVSPAPPARRQVKKTSVQGLPAQVARLKLPSNSDTLSLAGAHVPEEEPLPEGLSLTGNGRLQLPFSENGGNAVPSEGNGSGLLPEVTLPSLLSRDIVQVELRQRSLRISKSGNVYDREDSLDSWARVGQGVARLRQVLRGEFPLADESKPETSPPPSLRRVSSPAEGFAVLLEWMDEPHDRDLLFSPPIKALWQIAPQDFDGPVTLVARVRPDGSVSEVFPSTLDVDKTLLDSIMESVRKYRFSPLPPGDSFDQYATIVIQADTGGQGGETP